MSSPPVSESCRSCSQSGSWSRPCNSGETTQTSRPAFRNSKFQYLGAAVPNQKNASSQIPPLAANGTECTDTAIVTGRDAFSATY